MKPIEAHIAATGGSFRIDPLRDLVRQGVKVQTIDHVVRN
jgi:hypothetical protein